MQLLFSARASSTPCANALSILEDDLGVSSELILRLSDTDEVPAGSIHLFLGNGIFCARQHGKIDESTKKRPKRALQLLFVPEEESERYDFFENCAHTVPLSARTAAVLIAINPKPGSANVKEALRTSLRSCKEKVKQTRAQQHQNSLGESEQAAA